MNVEIIPAEIKHLDELLELAISTFTESYEKMNTPENFRKYISESFNHKKFLSELQEKNSFIFLMKREGHAVGYLKLNIDTAQSEKMDNEAMEIERIYVRKEIQGSGLGKRLLEKSRDVAREKNKKYLWLGVWERNNSAIRFYESQGFKKFGEHPFMLGWDKQTDILYRISV
jgi:ribosomal protein S18 acetylase RimI-like enzyme